MRPGEGPFLVPENVLSMSVSGMAPQLTLMKGLPTRCDLAWIALATSSLPVPVSPRISTGASVPDSLRTVSMTFLSPPEVPMSSAGASSSCGDWEGVS